MAIGSGDAGLTIMKAYYKNEDPITKVVVIIFIIIVSNNWFLNMNKIVRSTLRWVSELPSYSLSKIPNLRTYWLKCNTKQRKCETYTHKHHTVTSLNTVPYVIIEPNVNISYYRSTNRQSAKITNWNCTVFHNVTWKL